MPGPSSLSLGNLSLPLKCINPVTKPPPNTPASRRPLPPSRRGRPGRGSSARWPRRTLITVNGVVFLCLVAMASAYGYVRYEIGSIVTAPGPDLTPPGFYAGGAATTPQAKASDADGLQPENILLIGNETRQGLTPQEQQQFGSSLTYSGTLADIMMVLHLDPANRTASVLSIPARPVLPHAGGQPRRLLPENGRRPQRRGAGPDNLVQAVQEDLGIPINHFVELNFNGFINSVNALGGINVYFPDPVFDADSLAQHCHPRLPPSQRFLCIDAGAGPAPPVRPSGRHRAPTRTGPMTPSPTSPVS